MWKLLLLVLIFQIAYVESAPVDVDRAFGHGREYLYIYEGQLLIGLPHRSKEFTGIKILANVRLQFQVEDKVFAQLENIVIARFHDIWERPKEQLPMDIVLPISGPELDDFLEWLKKPIMVIYRSGLIIEVDSVPGEPIPSVNVKKAILSMFQITLQGETEDTVDWWSHRFYKVVENTITGECETAYEAKPLKTVALPKVDDADINVSDKKGDIPTTMYIKTKNMQECSCDLDTLEIPQGLIHQEGEAHSTESIVKATSVTTYIVAGTPTEFWIKSAVTDGQYLVAPLLTEIGPVTFTKQNLRLLNVSRWVPIDRRHSIMMTDVIEERIGGLQFELPPMAAVWGISATDELEKKPLVVDRAKMQLIGRMVSALVPEVGVEFDIEHAPELFMTLVEELKTLNELEWRELFDTWVIKTEDAAIELDKQASILLDAVPLVATDEALIVVFDMMKLGHIKIDVALRLLTGLPLMAPLKEEIVRELLSVRQAEPVIDQPLLRSSSLLALGAMVHKVCVKHAVCSEQTIKDIIEFLLPENLPEVSTEIQLLHLKALGNAGLPATLDTLIELAKNDVLAPDIRAQALYSLIKLTKNKVLAEKIRVKLLPLFVETTLDSEIRTASLVVLLNCDLTFPYFQLLALHTHDQQDPQVGAFVYSSLRTLASLRHPLFKKQAQMAKLVLPQAKPWPFAGLHMSKNLAMDIAIANDKLGILTSVGILGHPSLIPRSGAVQLDMIVMNRVVNAVQVGFRQQGLLPLLGKLVPGIAPKPLKKTAGTVPGIEGIAGTLKLKAKKPEKPKLNLYIKLLGNEVLTAEVNEILLEKIVSYIGKIHTIETDLREPQKLTFQKALMLGGNLRKVVTEIGVPLTIDAKASAMILAELEGQLKADPPIFTEKGQINKIEKVEGSLNLVPSMAALIKGFMGADATVIKTGIAIETTLQTATPLKTKIVLDVPGKKLQEFTTLPGKEMKLINVKITPHVITTGAVKATKVLETVAPKHEIVRKVDSLPLNDLLDRDLEVAAMCTQMGTGPLPWRCDPLSGPVVVDAVLKPKSPVDLEIQTDILLESKTRADILGPEWRMYESECLSSDRSVQAVKVSVAKKNIPDQKWIDAVVNIDILDGKYKGLATTLSLAPLLTTEELKICMQGEMVQPNSLTEQPSIEHLDKEIKMWVHLKTGETCEANPTMVEVTIAKTEQQIIDEEERATLEDELCREDILSGKPYSIDCRKLALRRSRLNKILVEITGEKLIEKEIVAAYPRIMAVAKHYLWNLRHPSFVDYLDHVIKRFVLEKTEEVWWWWWTDGVTVPVKDKLILLIEVDKTLTALDATLKTPTTWDMIRVKGLPVQLPTPSVKIPMLDQVVKTVMIDEITPSCKVMGSEINTFDKATFENVFDECNQLVAMDGTASEAFAVTAATKPQSVLKIVSVFLEKKKIDLIPSYGADFIINIDGQIKPLMFSERMLVLSDDEIVIEPLDACEPFPVKVRKPVLFEIRHHSANVELVADHIGLKVKTDGINFKVQASHLLRNNLIGLCGNFDGNVLNDNIAAHGLTVPSWKKFAETWKLTPEWCRVNRIPL